MRGITLLLSLLAVSAPAQAWEPRMGKDWCTEIHSGIGKQQTWHANTNGKDYVGGDPGYICKCLAMFVNLESCELKEKFPDGKSAWGYMTPCALDKGITQPPLLCGHKVMGSSWILTAGPLGDGKNTIPGPNRS
ncbi:hypothetical protein EJ03DRAFT_355730 [Teratosphaeria nubilosa]|uniref:Uncharacterized protein n=1 Tax=Teratosphaeria nubilosa TaxID=161662 RepID=A0A6G1KV07_9PEZI|nr:hypothetical protein EJ03DRAFT_355730 [Teratosphaeria nubilosa]